MANEINLEKIVQHKSFLEEFVDPDSGLLDELLRSRTLTRKEFRHIAEEKPYDNRNAKLLGYITDQGKCDSFVTALRNTKQEHIVNYLIADGEYELEFCLDWPLNEPQIATLDDNQAVLVQLMDMTDLVRRLYSKDVISTKQRNAICSEVNQDKQNEMFLEFLRRRSQSDFKTTIVCLIESKQNHVAEILEKQGVAVRVHATTDATVEAEREIAKRCMKIIGDRSLEECMRILEHMQFDIIAAKQGESVVFYILCQTLKKLEQLEASVKAGQFREFVEWFINEALPCKQKINVLSIKMEDEDCMRNKKSFEIARLVTFECNSPNGEEDESSKISFTTMDQLPLEVYDIILQKVYLYCTVLENSVGFSAQTIISQLSSVNFCWFQRLRKRNFKASILRRLLGFFRSRRPRHVVIQNNASYLQSLSSSSFEIDRLKSTDCITDAQAASIQRQRLKRFKRKTKLPNQNSYCALDICKIVKSLDERKYLSLGDCVHHNASRGISKLVETGGVAVKVELKERGKTKLTLAKLIERLTNVLNGKALETTQDNRLLNKLREDDLEILDVSLNRDVILWIWCRSQKGFENLRRPDNWKTFVEVFSGLTKVPLGQKFRINVDCENFKKTMVSSFADITFTKTLNFGEKGYEVKGITKFGSNIHVLCRVPKRIYVFEGQNEHRLLEQIGLEEIRCPKDIGSSTRDNCLYVTDSDERCVWKVTTETDQNQQKTWRIIKWLDTGIDFPPWTLSMASADQLVMVGGTWPHSLRVYGPDAGLCLGVELPNVITQTRHAVRTKSGNFIISHVIWGDIEMGIDAEFDGLIHQLRSMYRSEKEIEANEIKQDRGREHLKIGRYVEEIKETCWAISELSADGKQIVRLFIPGNETQKLCDARYMSIDSSDQLLVLDIGKERVVLLDSDLKWSQILFPREVKDSESGTKRILRIGEPYRIFYDEQMKQIVAAEGFMQGSVMVCKITTKYKLH